MLEEQAYYYFKEDFVGYDGRGYKQVIAKGNPVFIMGEYGGDYFAYFLNNKGVVIEALIGDDQIDSTPIRKETDFKVMPNNEAHIKETLEQLCKEN